MDIIVEGAIGVPILFQKSEGLKSKYLFIITPAHFNPHEGTDIVIAKIFELDQGVLTIAFNYCSHELINEVIVGFPGDPFVSGSDVIFVIKEALIIGPYV